MDEITHAVGWSIRRPPSESVAALLARRRANSILTP